MLFTKEFYELLEKEFTESETYLGYDADEDPGYFIEFLVEKLYRIEQKKEV